MQKKLLLNIEGMHCKTCADSIEMVLLSKEGIKEAKIDFEKSIAEITYEQEKIDEKEIIDSINEIGYKAKPLIE